MYRFPLVLLLPPSLSSPTHFHAVVFSHLSLYSTFFPPVSLRNKAEIPSGVRRDWRGNSVQWGGEALSPFPPQCVQPCRTLHRQAAAKQKGNGRKSYSGGQRAGPDQRSLSLTDWQMGIDALHFPRCAISGRVSRLPPLTHPFPPL